MNYSQTAPSAGAPAQQSGAHARGAAPASRRPGALTGLMATTALGALAAVIGSVVVYSGGRSFAESNVKEVIDKNPNELGIPPGVTAEKLKAIAGPMWDSVISDRYGTLSARAGFALLCAVLMLLAAAFARNAAVWARVLITVAAPIAAVVDILIVGDYEPTSVTGLSVVSLAFSLVSAVLCWVPPVNRFAKARKSARGAR